MWVTGAARVKVVARARSAAQRAVSRMVGLGEDCVRVKSVAENGACSDRLRRFCEAKESRQHGRDWEVSGDDGLPSCRAHLMYRK